MICKCNHAGSEHDHEIYPFTGVCLSCEKCKEFHPVRIEEGETLEYNKNGLPLYVMLDGRCGLQLQYGREYYRPAGHWEVDFKKLGSRLFVHEPDENSVMHHAHGLELFPCTKEICKADNYPYGQWDYEEENGYRILTK